MFTSNASAFTYRIPCNSIIDIKIASNFSLCPIRITFYHHKLLCFCRLIVCKLNVKNECYQKLVYEIRFTWYTSLIIKDKPKAFFLILNTFEVFNIEKVYCLCFYMHIKFLQNLQRLLIICYLIFWFGLWLLADKRRNKSLVHCYHLGNWGLINLQLILETVEHYRGSIVESGN